MRFKICQIVTSGDAAVGQLKVDLIPVRPHTNPRFWRGQIRTQPHSPGRWRKWVKKNFQTLCRAVRLLLLGFLKICFPRSCRTVEGKNFKSELETGNCSKLGNKNFNVCDEVKFVYKYFGTRGYIGATNCTGARSALVL